MKFYCGECWEEIGNCLPWCSEGQREQLLSDASLTGSDGRTIRMLGRPVKRCTDTTRNPAGFCKSCGLAH